MTSEIRLYKPNNSKNAPVKGCFAYPAIESFALSSLGYLSLYKTLEMNEDIYIEKVFTDSKNIETSAKDLDILGFSMSFEIDFLGVFKIFEKYNIPFLSSERNDNDPIVFSGGPVISANPEPFAEIFDFLMLGDGETKFDTIVEILKNNKNKSKAEILDIISQKDGFYVPSKTKYDPNLRKVTSTDGKPFFAKKSLFNLKNCVYSTILSENSYFKNTFIVEIERGCPQRCGFCLASYLNYPVRFLPFDEIKEKIEFGLQYTNKIALLGAAVALHPEFDKICQFLSEKMTQNKDLELSISSLRADSVSQQVIQTLIQAKQQTVTIAIEAGSERLRKVINKNLNEEQIFNTVKTVSENGLKGIKIYAMIGLPTETQQDIDELIDLIKRLKQQYKTFNISLSFATFVPKAQTPFQFCKREDSKSLEKKYNYLKKKFHQMGVKINCSSVHWDYYQALISRGDRRLSQYLINVYKNGGKLGAFKNEYKTLFKNKQLPSPDYYAVDAIDPNISNPWDYIQGHFSKQDLINEYHKLIK